MFATAVYKPEHLYAAFISGDEQQGYSADIMLRKPNGWLVQQGTPSRFLHKTRSDAEKALREMVEELKVAKEHPWLDEFRAASGIDPAGVTVLRVNRPGKKAKKIFFSSIWKPKKFRTA